MVWMDRVASRWLMVAAAFGAWCAGSVWALLELTRSYPGIVSMKPGRGAFELSEAAFGMPASHALAYLFLLAFAAMAFVGGLRRLLDPDRFAIDAVFWVLRSKTLWLALGIAATLALAGIWILRTRWDEVEVGIQIVVFLAVLLVPFAAWNAKILQREEVSSWWRLRWPGWQAITIAVAAIAFEAALEALLFLWSQWNETTTTLVACNVIDELVSFFVWIFVPIVWIERSTAATGWCSFMGILRWKRLRTILWQTLLAVVVAVGVAIPLLMTVILSVYVFPQYQEFAKEGGKALSWSLRALSEISRRFQILALLPTVIAMLMASLAQGRLLVSLGVGDRAEAP